VIVTGDLEAQIIEYHYEPEDKNTTVPENGILTLRKSDRSIDIYSADQKLNSEQARRLILEPMLFPGPSNDLQVACSRALLVLHCVQALLIKLEQVPGIFLRLRSSYASLETHSRGSSTAIACRHRNEFHEIERNVLITPRSGRECGYFVHEGLRGDANTGDVVVHEKTLGRS